MYISLYNTCMKILFLCVSYGMVCLIYIIYSESYDRNRDSFFILLLILPAVLLAPMFNNEFSLIEVSFSLTEINKNNLPDHHNFSGSLQFQHYPGSSGHLAAILYDQQSPTS
jgi:hypothetical protein